MRRFVIATLCVAAWDPVHAQVRAPAGALSAVADYSRALNAGDCEGLLALSAVYRRHPESREFLCAALKSWKAAGLHERLRQPTASLSSGAYRLVVVPKSRMIVNESGPTFDDAFYAAVSDDAGRRWQVIDIDCDNFPKWVKGLYPPYDGHPSFAPASVALTAR